MQINKMLRSFKYAFKGFSDLLKSENNFQFHFLAAIIVLVVGFVAKISKWEWIILVLMIGLVFMAEAFNTALEKLCDHITPEQNKAIGKIKDIAAAGVLIMATVAIIVAVLIFGKYFLTLFI